MTEPETTDDGLWTCPDCEGIGWDRDASGDIDDDCKRCDGTGLQCPCVGGRQYTDTPDPDCAQCGGTGKANRDGAARDLLVEPDREPIAPLGTVRREGETDAQLRARIASTALGRPLRK
ncbi:MAG: hypothetical protein CL819_09030 [Croceicoccus sp.]|nr:hypothetical protein [Croceicoccus sp.]